MSYIEKENLANKANYGGSRAISKIAWIVIHMTANDGDTDENNGKYFHDNKVGTSAHAFVDSDSVTISVPDNYIAYAVGKDYRTPECKGGKHYGKCTNTNSYSIELCDDNKNGVVYPSQATIDNAIEYTKKLMKKYNIPQSHVIRHFDVNNKPCPSYWTDDKKWKKEFWNKLADKANPAPVPTKNPYNEPTKLLKKGSTGNGVKWLQWELIQSGFLPAVNAKGNTNIDGDFGKVTEQAVKDFQSKYPDCGTNGKPDGEVGKKTRTQLKKMK